MKRMKNNLKREELGWIKITEKSFQDIWNNEKDDKTWSRFGSQPKLKKFKGGEGSKSRTI